MHSGGKGGGGQKEKQMYNNETARSASWGQQHCLLTSGDEPLGHVDTRGWRYGPRQLRVIDDDDDDDFVLENRLV